MIPIRANFSCCSHFNSCHTIEEPSLSESSSDSQFNIELKTDDIDIEIEKSKTVTGKRLGGCLLLVHVPDDGEHYAAWHVAWADLSLYFLTPQQKFIFESRLSSTLEYAYYRKVDWIETVNKNPGTTYICGPNVDKGVCDLFKINTENAFKTTKGPISVRFDVATLTFSAVGDGEVVGNLA